MATHIEIAQRKIDQINSDRNRGRGGLSVLQVLEANAVATLAVADALERLLAHLEDRAITVRSV